MANISPLGQRAIQEARRGDFDRALATANEALAERPADSALRFFAAMLHTRRFELDRAEGHLRMALSSDSSDPMIRAELIRVLAGLGKLEEAETLLSEPGLPSAQAARLQALVAAHRGDHARAADLYRPIVRNDPADFESWGNLGVALLGIGDYQGAVDALGHALRHRPDHSQFRDKWVDAQVGAGSAGPALEQIYAERSDQPAALVTAARLEDLQGRSKLAVDALARALELDPTNATALAALADLQERGNSIDELVQTLERLQHVSPASEKLPLLRARALFRQGALEAALDQAQRAPNSVDPAARAHLIGVINDRLGDTSAAFAAFEEMNRLDSLTTYNAAGKAERHLATLREQLHILTPEWIGRWKPAEPPAIEPAFLVGFPRSGTTLLDTLLTNDAAVAISEENPMLTEVSKRIGGYAAIADLDDSEVEELRRFYFDEATTHVPNAKGRLVLDKFPLALGAGALIHRLFPTAPVIFLARHPCDVVLSCYMTRFQPDETGSAFLTLGGTARLYDAMMSLWAKSRALLPLRVHDAHYESLVNDPAGELKQVAGFLGIGWSEQLLDNRRAAEGRGFIKTPSYAQVSEPIYRRAVERWRKYEEQLAPVIPVLKPWIAQLGYD